MVFISDFMNAYAVLRLYATDRLLLVMEEVDGSGGTVNRTVFLIDWADGVISSEARRMAVVRVLEVAGWKSNLSILAVPRTTTKGRWNDKKSGCSKEVQPNQRTIWQQSSMRKFSQMECLSSRMCMDRCE